MSKPFFSPKRLKTTHLTPVIDLAMWGEVSCYLAILLQCIVGLWDTKPLHASFLQYVLPEWDYNHISILRKCCLNRKLAWVWNRAFLSLRAPLPRRYFLFTPSVCVCVCGVFFCSRILYGDLQWTVSPCPKELLTHLNTFLFIWVLVHHNCSAIVLKACVAIHMATVRLNAHYIPEMPDGCLLHTRTRLLYGWKMKSLFLDAYN